MKVRAKAGEKSRRGKIGEWFVIEDVIKTFWDDLTMCFQIASVCPDKACPEKCKRPKKCSEVNIDLKSGWKGC